MSTTGWVILAIVAGVVVIGALAHVDVALAALVRAPRPVRARSTTGP